MQGAAGEAVVMDDDEEEAADGPDPEPLAFPDALPIALVDESLPVSESLTLFVPLVPDSCLRNLACLDFCPHIFVSLARTDPTHAYIHKLYPVHVESTMLCCIVHQILTATTGP